MNTNTNSAGTAALTLIGGLAALILGMVWAVAWQGLTISVLWGWFVAPLFGLPTLSIVQAYGMALVMRSVQGLTNQEKGKDNLAQWFGKVLILPPCVTGFILCIGWVLKAWA